MAIIFDNATFGSSANQTLSFSHTTGSLVDGGIFLGIMSQQSSGVPSSASVSYNSVSLSQVGTYSNFNNATLFVFFVKAPASGSHTVSISVTGSGIIKTLAMAATYGGVSQTTMPDAGPVTGDGGGGGSSVSLNVTPTSSTAWGLLFASTVSSTNKISSSTGSTIRGVSNGAQQAAIFDSNGTITGGIPYTMAASSTSAAIEGILISFPTDSVVYTLTASDSISNSASRFVTVSSLFGRIRTLSDSISNGSSRFAMVSRIFNGTRSMSDSVSNAASRFISLFTQAFSRKSFKPVLDVDPTNPSVQVDY